MTIFPFNKQIIPINYAFQNIELNLAKNKPEIKMK